MPYGNNDPYGEGFRPFTGPLERGLRLRAMMDQIKFEAEARDHARQQWQADLVNTQRQHQNEDLHTALALHAVVGGAMPVAPGMPGNAQAAFGGRSAPVQTTIGAFSFPTQEQAATAAGTMRGRARAAEDQAYDPNETVHFPTGGAFGGLGGRDVQVPRSKVGDVLIKLQESLRKKSGWKVGPPIINKETGDATFYGEDQDGNVKLLKTLPGVGGVASKESPTATQQDYEAQVSSNFHPERERRVGEMMPWAYAQLGVDANDHGSDDALKARKLAEQNVDTAIKEEYDTRVAQTRMASRATQKSTSTMRSAGAPLAGKSIKASDIPKIAAAKKMTPKAWQSAFEQQGGQVIP